jgi:hypothetical protein
VDQDDNMIPSHLFPFWSKVAPKLRLDTQQWKKSPRRRGRDTSQDLPNPSLCSTRNEKLPGGQRHRSVLSHRVSWRRVKQLISAPVATKNLIRPVNN